MEARDFVQDLQNWGLTQAQIAERTGIPQPTISKIARGTVDDVLSRNYRSLQTVHAEEQAKHPPDPKAGDQPAPTEQGA
jgi:predicted transcriptional regulator